MKTLLALSALSTLLCASAHAQKTTKKLPPRPTKPSRTAEAALLNGIFEGKLTAPSGIVIRLIFRFDGKGGLLIDVPDQGQSGIKPNAATQTKSKLTMEGPGGQWTYTGTASADGKTITGTLHQGGAELPLNFQKITSVVGPRRPQTPKPPFPYKTREVTVPNPKAPGVTLAGTLTIPNGPGPFPVVVFITGSGPQDRDETILQHKPFAVIADDLARRGIASVRCDDRGVAHSTGKFDTATTADFATDIAAIAAYLRSQPEVNPAKIGLIGHSEGGLIAPLVAADPDNKIAFIVLLAGPGVSGDQIIVEQSALIVQAMGQPEAAVANTRRQQSLVVAAARSEADPEKAIDKMGAAVGLTIVPPAVRARLSQLTGPWMHFFLNFDPAPTLAKVRCPVLALNGTKDLQVPLTQNLGVIEKTLKESGNTDVTCVPIDGLNHLFQHAKTGAPSEYSAIEETFDPATLARIGNWITAHTKAP